MMSKPERVWFNRSKLDSEIPPFIRLWLLRILVPLGGHRKFIQSTGFYDDDLAEALDLGGWIEPTDGEFDSSGARSELRRLYRTAETRHLPDGKPILLHGNLERLGEIVGLDAASRQILEFVILMETDWALNSVAGMIEGVSGLEAIKVLSVILNLPDAEVKRAVGPQSSLAESGILRLKRDGKVAPIARSSCISRSGQ